MMKTIRQCALIVCLMSGHTVSANTTSAVIVDSISLEDGLFQDRVVITVSEEPCGESLTLIVENKLDQLMLSILMTAQASNQSVVIAYDDSSPPYCYIDSVDLS